MKAITAKLKELNYHVDDEYAQKVKQLKKDWDAEVDRIRSIGPEDGSEYLPQPTVIGILNDFMGDRDVVVNAAGSTPGDLQRTWRSKGPKTYHVEYGYSCMGYEIAAGLGIKLVDPEREVYVIQGDGGYLMMHTEIVTSLLEDKKIIILLFDSEGFNSISNLQESLGSNGFGCDLRKRNPKTGLMDRGGPIHKIDYAMNARSYGAAAYTVHSLEELKDALKKAKQEDKTTLIHIKIKRWSQTGGYESWWRVDVAEVSTMPRVQQARKDLEEHLKKARKY